MVTAVPVCLMHVCLPCHDCVCCGVCCLLRIACALPSQLLEPIRAKFASDVSLQELRAQAYPDEESECGCLGSFPDCVCVYRLIPRLCVCACMRVYVVDCGWV